MQKRGASVVRVSVFSYRAPKYLNLSSTAVWGRRGGGRGRLFISAVIDKTGQRTVAARNSCSDVIAIPLPPFLATDVADMLDPTVQYGYGCGWIITLDDLHQTADVLSAMVKVDGSVLITRKQRRHLQNKNCLLYTSPSPRDGLLSRMPSSA